MGVIANMREILGQLFPGIPCAAIVAASLVAFGCTTNTGARAAAIGAADGDASDPASLVQTVDAGSADSVRETTVDASPVVVCPSIDEACAREAGAFYHCVRDWATAQLPSTWCADANSIVSIHSDCGGYDIVEESPQASDVATDYYYSLTSGMLVGVELYSFNVGAASCLAVSVNAISVADCAGSKPAVSLCDRIAGDASAE